MIKNSNVTIMVSDMDRAVAFYESLGLKLENRWGEHYAQVSAPGIVIGLHPSEKTGVKGSGSVSIGFTWENFDEAKSLLEKLNVKFTERNEDGGNFLHFADPDGTELYVIKPKW